MLTDNPGTSSEDRELPPEEQWRAGTYSLIGRLLAAPPDVRTLVVASGSDRGSAPEAAPESPLASAWQELARAAAEAHPEGVDDEFHDLFIGVGRGELVPFASWYLTGLLMEEPLVRLRRDLAHLGFERQEGTSEPEDHIAALLEVMAVLIRDGEPLARQREFFQEHVGPWAGTFFRDLEGAESAGFYRSVGRLGGRFVDLEHQHLAMAE